MTFIDAIILGIVEGFTEFLPISSTGHLIIAEQWLGLSSGEFEKTFTIVIQVGAILAVLWVYWRKFLDVEMLKRIAAAFVPTAIIGLLLHGFAKEYLLGNVTVVAWALFIGGIVLILFEWWQKGKIHSEGKVEDISLWQAGVIGLAQSVAIIPGVSRSGASILGGVALGISRSAVVEFSFLLAVPTIGAASLLDVLKINTAMTAGEIGLLLVSLIVSFFVALASIKFLLAFVKKYSFVWFGVYRILLGLLLLFV